MVQVSAAGDRYWIFGAGDGGSCAGAGAVGARTTVRCASNTGKSEARRMLEAVYRAELLYHAGHGRFTARLADLSYRPEPGGGYQARVSADGESIVLVVSHRGTVCTLSDRAVQPGDTTAERPAPFCQQT